MNRMVLLGVGLLAVLFVGVSVGVWREDAADGAAADVGAEAGGNGVAADVEAEAGGNRAADDRDRLRSFWSIYREATAFRLEGRHVEAIDAYEQALALNDRHEDALYYVGSIHMELGEFEDAEAVWLRLIDINPTSARTLSQLGDLYLCPDAGARFDLDAAEDAFRRAKAINKEETGALLHLGQIALIRGDSDQAGYYLDAVLGSNAGSVDAHFYKGFISWRGGRTNEAAAHFERAVRHARPEAPPPGMSAEGDTRQGVRPMLATSSMCRLFSPMAGQLLEENRSAESFYSGLAERLAPLH